MRLSGRPVRPDSREETTHRSGSTTAAPAATPPRPAGRPAPCAPDIAAARCAERSVFAFPSVSHAPYGIEQLFRLRHARRPQLCPDIFDVLCHGGVVRSAVNAKSRFVNLLLGKGLPCVQRQILTDGILRAGQGQHLPLHRRALGGQVKGYAVAHHPVRRGAALPPQMCRNPRPQLSHPEGLGQKVVCPDAQPLQHSGLIGAGAQKQDGHFGQAADAPTDRKAVLPGHHHVQQDAVCPAAKRLGQISACLPRFYPVAVPLQSGADQLAEL